MDRSRPPHQRVTFNVHGPDAEAVRRVASLVPGYTPHQVAVHAMRAGLRLVEAEIMTAARTLVSQGEGSP